MKKKIIALSFFIVFIVVIILSQTIPFIKNRIYFGDRIIGTINMTVDGKQFVPSGILVQEENDSPYKVTLDKSTKFSIKGGMYGGYKISFVLNNNELSELTGNTAFKSDTDSTSLNFTYVNTNWWHITDINFTVQIVLVEDEWVVNCKVTYKESLEEGGFSEKTIVKSLPFKNIYTEQIILQFGL